MHWDIDCTECTDCTLLHSQLLLAGGGGGGDQVRGRGELYKMADF